jgi:glycosyltransferase involved in cell wall biosynthesis
MSSWYHLFGGEPFGRVSIEGSCFSVLAVVARSGGLPENVEPGHDGFVFEPRDDQRLAELLNTLITGTGDRLPFGRDRISAKPMRAAGPRSVMIETVLNTCFTNH